MDRPPQRAWTPRRRGATRYLASALAGVAVALIPSLTRAADLTWSSDWRRVGAPEYVIAPALLAASGAMVLLIDGPTQASWSRPILFDAAARDALVASTPSGRKTVATISDVLVTTSIAYPAVDALLVPWAVHGSRDVAWQLVWIDAQAYALTSALNTAVKYAVARERPWGSRCPSSDLDCANHDRYLSFYSSHSANAATGAGLTCAHHSHLALYSSRAADGAACIGAVTLALATGTLRVVADKHWASDVVFGELIGFASGYLIPTLVYYHSTSSSSATQTAALSESQPSAAMLPLVGPNGFSLGISGRF